jgi:PhzF family phenazine biosynthesis protein
MNLPIFLVDAFTDVPFKGNPAGVCILDREIDDALKQKIAAEVGASETAYFNPATCCLRWFTPKLEIDLCGHATLATVCVLRHTQRIQENQEVRFSTRSGELRAKTSNGKIQMDFPLAREISDVKPNADLLARLGIQATEVLLCAKSGTMTMIVVRDETIIRRLAPDFAGLLKLDAFGVIVTAAASTPGFDFASRYFHPWAGVNEDPVTGSAHCVLAKYWGKILGKTHMTGYQASARGGQVGVQILNDSRVLLIGRAVITIQGQIAVDA